MSTIPPTQAAGAAAIVAATSAPVTLTQIANTHTSTPHMAAVDRLVPELVNSIQEEDEYECVDRAVKSRMWAKSVADMKVYRQTTRSQPTWQPAHLLGLQ